MPDRPMPGRPGAEERWQPAHHRQHDARAEHAPADRSDHRVAARAPADLPYLVPPDDATDALAIDHDYTTPPPARPRPSSVVDRERPQPVTVEPAPTAVVAPAGHGGPAVSAVRTAEPATARSHAPQATVRDSGPASHPAAGPMALPPVSTSPVVDLPRIEYPQFTPVEAPVLEPAAAGARRRRPLQVALALGLLGLGGYGATWVFAPGHPSARPASPTRAEAAPAQSPAPAAGSAPAVGVQGTSLAARTPAAGRAGAAESAPQGPMPPASSGFAPALESRAIVKPAPPAESSGGSDSLPGVAPAPIDLSVPVPMVIDPDSLAPVDRRQGDSTLKKILRAVNGGKELPARP